jgi:hypothetical protein
MTCWNCGNVRAQPPYFHLPDPLSPTTKWPIP